MKHYLSSKVKVCLLYIAQAILFAIPLGVFMYTHKDTFFVQKSVYGIAGLGILGLIIWALCLAKIFTKLPKILYFVILFFAFLALDMLSGYLKDIGTTVLIGACLSLPLNPLIYAVQTDGEVDLKERSRMKAIKRMKKQKVDVEVGD